MEFCKKDQRCEIKSDLSVFDPETHPKLVCRTGADDPLVSDPPINVLLIADQVSMFAEGLSSVNRNLIVALAGYSGVGVTTTVFAPTNRHTESLINESKELHVRIISLSEDVCSIDPDTNPLRLYSELSTSPQNFDHRFRLDGVQSRSYTHIIGHSPISCKLAIHLCERLFRDAKLILFFHIIPGELEWLANDNEIARQSDEEHMEMAQRADVVFSVTPKVHKHFDCLFREESRVPIDHRLFIPIASKEVSYLNNVMAGLGARTYIFFRYHRAVTRAHKICFHQIIK